MAVAAAESGGAPLDLLVHDYDQALWLFGAPESATARTVGSPNVIECSLHYPGGLEVAIAGGWYTENVPFAMEFDLQASEGELRYANDHLQLLRPPAAPTEIALPQGDPYATQLALFYRLLPQRSCSGRVSPGEFGQGSGAGLIDLRSGARHITAGCRRLRIAVDMDEVLADALGKQLRAYNEHFGANGTAEELHGLELADIVPQEHQPWVLGMLHQPGFFADLEWIPGAREEMEKLCAAHDIFIASAATEFPTSFVDKLNWLERHLPRFRGIGWFFAGTSQC